MCNAIAHVRALFVVAFGGADSRPMEAQMKTCPDCGGDGVVDKGTDEEQRCPTCGGLGIVPDDDDQEEVLNTAALPRRIKRS
jgi:hypothetical protein